MDSEFTDKKKRFFVSPLDWGLGHASRIVPIIFRAKEHGEVFLGVDERSAAFFKEIFPELIQIPLKGYQIKYAKKNLNWKLIFQIPRIKLAIFREHFQLKRIVKHYKIDIVISDSRFGLWHNKTRNYIVSHQLQILYSRKMYLFGRLLNLLNKVLLNRFDACLIPDSEDRIFSGILSQNTAVKKKIFIGRQSRFNLLKPETLVFDKFDLVFVLSGPEPQRSILEKIFVDQIKNTIYSALVICGKPEDSNIFQISPIHRKVSHLNDNEFAAVLKHAKCVFSRSGYSSLMDYAALRLSQVVLIPTPGQTEQAYLANKFSLDHHCFTINQNDFLLEEAIEKVKSFDGFGSFCNTQAVETFEWSRIF